ncbi:hypothetical protein C8Q80DRAFT_1274850 [Daedaleopsis nitida]|nr:hypothetical protein C8Q80DRAFT_1274850 [Daedaleopsis nitida]
MKTSPTLCGTSSKSGEYAYDFGTGTRTAPYTYKFLAQQPYVPLPLFTFSDSISPSPLSVSGKKEPKKKRRKYKSKRRALSVSHSTSSQSATALSLLSPLPSTMAFAPVIAAADSFVGFPGAFRSSEPATGMHAEAEDAAMTKQWKTCEYLLMTGFPSVMFCGPELRGGDMGVFLAYRGDERNEHPLTTFKHVRSPIL